MLDQFYHTIFRDLQQVNMKNSAALCDEIVGALAEVRASWAQLAENERRTGAPESAAAEPKSAQAADRPEAGSLPLSIARKSVVEGTSGSVRVDFGGRRIVTKKNKKKA